MTTAVSAPSVYVDFSQRPAEFAQSQFSEKFWTEALGYITSVAFAALALIANVLLAGADPLAGAMIVNTYVLALGYYLVMPFIASFFADARKAQRQGDKEMLIDAKMTELQRLDDQTISTMLTDRGIQYDPGVQNAQVTPERRRIGNFDHKLARVIYYENRASASTNTSVQLKTENKFVESAEAQLAAAKAKTKAAFYASLIPITSHGFSKFNDAFTWTGMSIADRLARRAANHPSGLNLLERKGDAAQVLSEADLNGSLGDIGRRLNAMLRARAGAVAY